MPLTLDWSVLAACRHVQSEPCGDRSPGFWPRHTEPSLRDHDAALDPPAEEMRPEAMVPVPEIFTMVRQQDAPEATATLVACMQAESLGVPISVEADQPSDVWVDAA